METSQHRGAAAPDAGEPAEGAAGAQADAAEAERAAALLQIEDEFYRVLAGGTRMYLLTSMVDLGLAPLLLRRGPLTEAEIVAELGLHPGRARKWVLLLEQVGLIVSSGEGAARRYDQVPMCRALADPEAPNHFFYRDFLRYWRVAAGRDLFALLRGAPVPDPVRYPPVLWEDVVLLHEWMRDGALTTLRSLQRRFDFSPYRRMLDVAGGDATMALTLARQHPELEITVFNLPAAATLCRKNVSAAGLGRRVHVVEGDFRTDPFPGGFDLVQFSRVMADWSQEVCRMLMEKAHRALGPGGRLLITEPLADHNPDLAIAWEHSYLPYDDFGAQVYKPLSVYEELLRQTGFRVIEKHGRDDTIHAVILAEREG